MPHNGAVALDAKRIFFVLRLVEGMLPFVMLLVVSVDSRQGLEVASEHSLY